MSHEQDIEDLKHKRAELANGYSRNGRPFAMNHTFDDCNERCFAAKRAISAALADNAEPTNIARGFHEPVAPLIATYKSAVGQLEMFIRLNP